MPGQLFVISGPSGAGKSSIVNALLGRTDGLVYSISHTSRRPRGTENDGIDYHFVDSKTFNRMIEAGAFVEWARVYDDFYGTSFFKNLQRRGKQADKYAVFKILSYVSRTLTVHVQKNV